MKRGIRVRRMLFALAAIFIVALITFRLLALVPSVHDSLCRAMARSIYRGQDALYIICLAAGADPNRKVVGSTPALHAAAEMDRAGIIRVLLICGADPNLRAKFDATPLWYARQATAQNAARILIASGAYSYVSPNAP